MAPPPTSPVTFTVVNHLTIWSLDFYFYQMQLNIPASHGFLKGLNEEVDACVPCRL